jgi:TfoX/Sxy family transcriptional regulator of competence genes
MATRPEFADAIRQALSGVEDVVIKPMFGEYGIWVEGKIVGLICDDLLFLKPSKGVAAHVAGFDEAPPYPGAKPSFIVPEAYWSNKAWITKSVIDSAHSLPAPKPKKPKP